MDDPDAHRLIAAFDPVETMLDHILVEASRALTPRDRIYIVRMARSAGLLTPPDLWEM